MGKKVSIKDIANKVGVSTALVSYLLSGLEDELFAVKHTDAVLFATNSLSIYGLYAIKKRDIKIPEELALIGFDGHEAFDLFEPSISCIQQPLLDVGIFSVQILLAQIKGVNITVHADLKHQLIEKDSISYKKFQSLLIV